MANFEGRSKELFQIRKLLFEDSQNVSMNALLILGEPGVGKTSLAYAASQNYRNQTQNLKKIIDISAYMKTWDIIIPELARDLLIDVSSKSNISELEERIINYAIENPILIQIDNLTITDDIVINFINNWSAAKNSNLLITINQNISITEMPNNCGIFQLEGITEEYAVFEILGEKLATLIDKCNLSSELKALKGNPQKLLYLRWRSPELCSDIIHYINELNIEEENYRKLETIRNNFEYPVEHFLALGRVRQTEIDEALIAHLWDQLGMGTTELYSRCLNQLIDEKLIEKTPNSGLRISAGVHVQLEKQIINTVGERQICNIDYFLGEYFRRRFAKKDKNIHSLKDLESYVYHMIRSGNLDSAYSYVFERNELDLARSRGLSVEVEPILHHFYNEIERIASESNRKDSECVIGDDLVKNQSENLIKKATVAIEMGRIYKDLSRHFDCLEAMDNAYQTLQSIPASYKHQPKITEMKIKINHFRGIAYSQIGRTVECIISYNNSIVEAIKNDYFTATEALSLGYLAYELKFHDMEASIRIAKKAVEISKKIGHLNVYIKNLCSLGQILSFAGDLENSIYYLREAEKLCQKEPTDVRELGRIFINSAVSFIGSRLWDQAESILDKADNILGESGDRRRKWMGIAYRGILKYHLGDQDSRINLILQALVAHKNVGAIRETIYESLTLLWMKNCKISNINTEIIKNKDLPEDTRIYLSKISNDYLQVFISFWENCYLPTLLTLKYDK